MPARHSRKIIFAAIVANLAIAGIKFLAAVLTKSSAMMSEAVHSLADTGNELLLLLGLRRSARPPNALRPFGHGKVLYFYSLLVVVYILPSEADSPSTKVSCGYDTRCCRNMRLGATSF